VPVIVSFHPKGVSRLCSNSSERAGGSPEVIQSGGFGAAVTVQGVSNCKVVVAYGGTGLATESKETLLYITKSLD
jgi:hypothetical protein